MTEIIYEAMRENLLETVKSEFYTPMSPRELKVVLGIEGGDEPLFNAAIDDLLTSGELCTTKRGKIIPVENSGYITGTFRATTRGFGFVLHDGGEIYVSREHLCGAMNGNRVQVKQIKAEEAAIIPRARSCVSRSTPSPSLWEPYG